MIQMFEIEVDTGTDDEEGVTVEEVERLLLGYDLKPPASEKVALGARATVLVEEVTT